MPLSPPKPGALRQRVKFQRQQRSGNVAGVPQTGWADIVGGYSMAAALTATTGGEDIIAGRVAGRAVYDLWVRKSAFTATITTADRAVDARNTSRVFNIRFVEEVMRDGGSPSGFLFMQLEADQ